MSLYYAVTLTCFNTAERFTLSNRVSTNAIETLAKMRRTESNLLGL